MESDQDESKLKSAAKIKTEIAKEEALIKDDQALTLRAMFGPGIWQRRIKAVVAVVFFMVWFHFSPSQDKEGNTSLLLMIIFYFSYESWIVNKRLEALAQLIQNLQKKE